MIIAVVLFAALGAVYALVYYLNHQTPVPKGCEDLKASCRGCKDVSCGNNPVHDETEKGKKV